ncbi:hypothetical protein FRB99_007946 [Tulasnella sp. 403]|nr:hypothetical protein FRB99_007946 [Tulasnella sp. 403]
MKGDVFGSKGDFITSPEISQVFGELVGIWLLSRWLEDGKPRKTRLIELGPGRGTLMDDIVRTMSTFKEFKSTLETISLVETSEHLRKQQQEKLKPHGIPIQWHARVEDIEQGIMSALDVDTTLPAPQGVSMVPKLKFVLAPGSTPTAEVLSVSSPRFSSLSVGSQIEVSPASWAIAKNLGNLLASPSGGAALLIDYGDMRSFSNSFRAFRKHKVVDVFDELGSSDLTANVDFAYLKEAMSQKSLHHGFLNQREFLLKMGIEVRTAALSRLLPEDRQRAVKEGVTRLIDPLGMGGQYKVMAVTPTAGKAPYPFGDDTGASA